MFPDSEIILGAAYVTISRPKKAEIHDVSQIPRYLHTV